MCQLVTFSSYVVQFAAVCDINQASASVETCSVCRLHMRCEHWGERKAKDRKRGSIKRDGAGAGKKESRI